MKSPEFQEIYSPSEHESSLHEETKVELDKMSIEKMQVNRDSMHFKSDLC